MKKLIENTGKPKKRKTTFENGGVDDTVCDGGKLGFGRTVAGMLSICSVVGRMGDRR